MADYSERIAASCKQLRLSSNLAERAMSQEGETNQEFLCKLLENEIEYRRKTRIIKLQNSDCCVREVQESSAHIRKLLI